jgi:sterol desaturase/sphingolipid hydroxylase (fatty acid hydroxylase superfamily)
MTLLEYVTWGALACLPLFLIIDLAHRAHRYEAPRFWRLRAFAVTIVAVALSFVVPMGWAAVVGDWSLFDLSPLGTWGGALVGILVYQFFHYWYHRAVHGSDVLWRATHQMHHAPESLDAFGAYFIAPTDAFMFLTIGTLVFAPLLGLSPLAAAIGNLFLTFCAVFQHANLRTPRWLGYIIQRPESHSVHHERGVHAYNYADLPLWDMVFGTFRNPEDFREKLGFYDGASSRIGEMLIFKDVSVPPVKEPAAAEQQPQAA